MPKRKSRRRKGISGLWASLKSRVGVHGLWSGVLILFGIYVIVFYGIFVAPYGLRWRGLFGDINYPDGFSIRGLDVSHHQGDIDWTLLRHAEVGDEPLCFVFIKATEGLSLIDKNFKKNFNESVENGFIRGAYHYFIPNISASLQARHFIRQAELEPGDLPPVLDIETAGDLDPAQLRDSALVWLRMTEQAYGAKPILYTYYKFKKEYLYTPEFDEYPYWIAHYYVDTIRYDGPWKFWQHTDRGRLPGIRGYVDLNCYNGSMYDLRKLTLPAPEY